MKKSAKKVKSAKRSKSSQPETQMPDLIAVMLKLTERLEAVERKMDLVISQTQQRPQQQSHQAYQPQRPQEQNFNRAPQQNQQHRPGGKPMFPAVCADCKKNCEVPFRPSPERAAYCKECYGRRKNAGNFQKFSSPSSFPAMEKRQLKVVNNGVGKTTISELVPAKKKPKPSKKSKR